MKIQIPNGAETTEFHGDALECQKRVHGWAGFLFLR